MTFDDFKVEVTNFPQAIGIRQRAATRPRMSVNISITPCDAQHECLPMKVEAWRAKEAQLKKEMVDEDIVDRPDTTFEIGVTTMGGQPAIYIYQSGQFFGNDDRGNPKGAYSHAYAIHFNDGINLARVTVAFTDDPRDSLEDMKRVLPRSFLERVATAFFDVYTQAWAS